MKKPKQNNSEDQLRKKWKATGFLDGLHLNNNINVNGCSNTGTGAYLNTGTGAYLNTVIGAGINTGTLTIDDGNYFIPQTGYYSTFLDIPNENEFTIDVSKRLVKIYDFSKNVSTYLLKKFKSIIVKDEEHSLVLIERDLKPGELTQIRDYIQGELILEFSEDLDDRYGEKYNLNKLTWTYNNYPPVINITGTGNLLANDLVTIQPLPAPTGLLFYMDNTYHNLTINVNNTNDMTTFNCNNTITTTNKTTNSEVNTSESNNLIYG